MGEDRNFRLKKKGGIMIDSNQSEFAGATPENASLANWNWLKDRVQKSGFDPFHDWLEDQLLDLEANYEGWVTSKSRKLAVQTEIRSSRG